MVIDEGLQDFTMEALARQAGVSSPLVYNYFASRHELLQALLLQEYGVFVEKMTADVRAAAEFRDVVRVFVTSNFDHHAAGNILPILQSQPEIAEVIRAKQAEHQRGTARFLVRRAAERFELTRAQAELVVAMSSGASIAAADYGVRAKVDREATIDQVVTYVLAGIETIARGGASR
jgi:AcrR family transcriptional regulator